MMLLVAGGAKAVAEPRRKKRKTKSFMAIASKNESGVIALARRVFEEASHQARASYFSAQNL